MVVVVVMLVNMQGRGSEAQLVENFYSSSCPNVESIVKQAVSTKFSQTFTTIPATLRLFFHDCFVEVHISYSFLYSSCTFKLKIHVIYDIMIHVNQSINHPSFLGWSISNRDAMPQSWYHHQMGTQRRTRRIIFRWPEMDLTPSSRLSKQWKRNALPSFLALIFWLLLPAML